MKDFLESYDALFFLMGLTCVALMMKVVSYVLYHRLMWDAEQMGSTQNKWMKAMMSKFEAYYKLKISVHNVENFVDRYLYHYSFWGMSLQSWENVGTFFLAALAACSALLCMTAGYLQLTGKWFWVTGIVTLVLFCVQGAAELFFDTHKCWNLLRIQMIDYMENTMRARLENEIFHKEEMKQYQMEYFRPVTDQEKKAEKPEEEEKENRIAASMEAATGMPEIQELLESFAKEKKLDQEISEKKKKLSDHQEDQKAQLFEEILEEFL